MDMSFRVREWNTPAITTKRPKITICSTSPDRIRASPNFTFGVFVPASKPPPADWIRKQMTSLEMKVLVRNLAGMMRSFCPFTARTMRPRYMYTEAAKRIDAKSVRSDWITQDNFNVML